MGSCNWFPKELIREGTYGPSVALEEPLGAQRVTESNPSIRFSFPPTARVKRRSEFRLTQLQGGKVHTRHFIIAVRPNDRNRARLGVTVTKRIGHSPARNRIKRLIRETFRLHPQWFSRAADYVFIAKRGAESLMRAEVEREVEGARRALAKAGAPSGAAAC